LFRSFHMFESYYRPFERFVNSFQLFGCSGVLLSSAINLNFYCWPYTAKECAIQIDVYSVETKLDNPDCHGIATFGLLHLHDHIQEF